MSLIRADARALPIAAGVVHCCVTSPPYFGLRDYGVAGQIGLEDSPAAYVASLVAVFREVWRVLREDGTCWVNLGDSYATSPPGNKGNGQFSKSGLNGAQTSASYLKRLESGSGMKRNTIVGDLKPKDLIGIPWRVAFALQADGWYLRSDIIWAKPNPMPESVTDRPTKAHEYVFLLTKAERYWYDAATIREPNTLDMQDRAARGHTREPRGKLDGSRQDATTLRGVAAMAIEAGGRNKRSVWTIPTQSYTGAHFATMPEALIEPCILAGCPLGGLVLDPFLGSGTVGAVASRLGRRWVGTDLTYQTLSAERTAQRGLIFTAL